MESVP